ncbi:MAG: type II toxin-antitoxin system ParD family antitoxin [Verrucomicrobiales bacterium]|nr:type II toxin-antitoxin system ParD family antitoxin [Verrucomicrobiales bacterium]
MPTQNVNLTPELDRFVKQAVETGAFKSASEVHRAALSAMSRQQEERALRLARLRQEIQAGLNSGSPVEVGDLDSFLEKCAAEASSELRDQIG